MSEKDILNPEVPEKESGTDLWKGLRGDKTPRWYVVHTYSGHEKKVKVNIEKMVENRGMQDLILAVDVPEEEIVEVKDGDTKKKIRKLFPGYVIVKMIVTNESWYLVRNTQGVTGFVGHGSDPIPLSDDEVRRMGIEKVYVEMDLKVGDTIKVISGPFSGVTGIIEEVNEKQKKVKAKSSWGSSGTTMALDFAIIEKL